MDSPYQYQSYNIIDNNKILKFYVNCKNRASAENIMKDEMFYNGNTEEQIEGAISVGHYEDNKVEYIIKTNKE